MPPDAAILEFFRASTEDSAAREKAKRDFLKRWKKAQIYEKFFAAFDAVSTRSEALLPGTGLLRALHVDRPEGKDDLTMFHLALSEAAWSKPSYNLRDMRRDSAYISDDNPRGRYLYTQYDPSAFHVVTTSGVAIREWEVIQAYGLHIGNIDHVDGRYNPLNEAVHIGLTSGNNGRMAWLRVARSNGSGAMDFPGMKAWVQPVPVSVKEQAAALEPLTQAQDMAASLGRAA